LFKGLDRTIDISEIVLKDKMINVHSHTRILEILKPYQATTWSDHDHGLCVLGQEDLGKHSTMTTTNAPAYFTYLVNKSSRSTWTIWVPSLYDDILFYPKTEEEPFNWLRNI